MSWITVSICLCYLIFTTGIADEQGSIQFARTFRHCHQNVYTGSTPGLEEDFQYLKNIDVTVIICVDGAIPDVKTAAKFGIQYHHVPMGYDALTQKDILKLAKVIENYDGNIFIHCHHGKHRAPAAAAGVLAYFKKLTSKEALSYLKISGTSPEYRGLYQSVKAASTIPSQDLAHIQLPPAQVPPSSFKKTMTHMDERLDNLEQFIKNQNSAKIREQALLLLQDWTESQRSATNLYVEKLELPQDQKADFLKLANQSCQSAQNFYDFVASKNPKFTVHQIQSRFQQLKNSCSKCHKKFRN